MVPPRYQSIESDQVRLVTSADGSTIIRLIAGELGGYQGPGMTRTPIVYAHVSLMPGSQLRVLWPEGFNAMVYALAGRGVAGRDNVPFAEGEAVVFGAGDVLMVRSDGVNSSVLRLEVLLLGGAPLREPVFSYGSFVMNTRSEILQAIEDFQSGKMGHIPAAALLDDDPS